MFAWLRFHKKKDPKAELKESLGDFELPSFPLIAQRVLQMLRDPEITANVIGEALAEDPGLSAKVLGIANSSAFALRHPVANVGHAISLLGRSSVEALILGVVVRRSLPDPDVAEFDSNRFWAAAARRATAARALADLIHPGTRSEAFTASLLSEMAVPLIAQAHGSRYGQVLQSWHERGGDLAELESAEMGFDHATVAGWVGQHWDFPELLADAIGSHHQSDESTEAPLPAVALVSPLGEMDEAEGLEEVVQAAHLQYGLDMDEVRELLRRSFEDSKDIAQRMAG